MKRYKRNNHMLTSSELARLLNVHVNTIRRWTNRGVLKAYRIGPRRDRRFHHDDINGFISERPEERQSVLLRK